MEQEIKKTEKKINKRTYMAVIAVTMTVLIVLLGIWAWFNRKEDVKEMRKYPETTKKGVIAEIGDTEISEKEWDYYFTAMLQSYANSQGEYIDKIDWNEKDKDGVTLLEKVKLDTQNEIVRSNVIVAKAKELGIELTDEEKNIIEIDWDYWVQVHGDDVYKAFGIEDKADFEKMEEKRHLENKVAETVSQDIKKYSNGADLSKYATEDRATIKLIELPMDMYNEATGADAKTQMENIKARLDAGEDFDTVWLEVMGEMYMQMYGIEKTKADEYHIEKGTLTGTFENIEKAAFDLEIGETSGIVETDGSYAIVTRVAGYAELVNMWIAESDIKVNYGIMDSASIDDVEI